MSNHSPPRDRQIRVRESTWTSWQPSKLNSMVGWFPTTNQNSVRTTVIWANLAIGSLSSRTNTKAFLFVLWRYHLPAIIAGTGMRLTTMKSLTSKDSIDPSRVLKDCGTPMAIRRPLGHVHNPSNLTPLIHTCLVKDMRALQSSQWLSTLHGLKANAADARPGQVSRWLGWAWLGWCHWGRCLCSMWVHLTSLCSSRRLFFTTTTMASHWRMWHECCSGRQRSRDSSRLQSLTQRGNKLLRLRRRCLGSCKMVRRRLRGWTRSCSLLTISFNLRTISSRLLLSTTIMSSNSL